MGFEDSQVYSASNMNRYENVATKDSGFMHWFLSTEQQIDDLINQWRGLEKNMKGEWVAPKDPARWAERRVMTEPGIAWCYQFLRSVLGRANMSSSYNEEYMNFVMREYISVPLFSALEAHFYDFGFKRGVDLETVGVQICNLSLAILLGARANGYRQFLTLTHQVNEVKQTGQDEQKKGLFSAIGSMFNKQQAPSQQYYNG
jgi:hypothetical protein